jgi:Flp pilus assembly protein TadD
MVPFISTKKRTDMKHTLTPILLMAVSLSGCASLSSMSHAPQQSSNNSASLMAARKALSEGAAATSLSIAHGILSMRPNDVDAMVAEGDANVQLGNRHTAEMEYKQALAIDPASVKARLGLGKLVLANDAREAERSFRAVLATSPHNAAALTDLGVALDLQERHREAQASYQAALDIDPNLTSPRVDLAVSLALSGDPAKAEGLLRDASESGAMPARVRADYALAEVMAGHSDDATQTLQADLSADEAKSSVTAMEGLRNHPTAAVPVAVAPAAPVPAPQASLAPLPPVNKVSLPAPGAGAKSALQTAQLAAPGKGPASTGP